MYLRNHFCLTTAWTMGWWWGGGGGGSKWYFTSTCWKLLNGQQYRLVSARVDSRGWRGSTRFANVRIPLFTGHCALVCFLWVENKRFVLFFWQTVTHEKRRCWNIRGKVLYMVAFRLPVLFPHDICKTLPDDKILDWSKLKQIADDILKCI